MKPKKKGRTARRIDVKNWHAKALELSNAGFSFRAIAAKLGKAVSTVHAAIEEEIAAIPAPGVEIRRERHGEQLDALIAAHLQKAKRDPESAHVVIAAIRQSSKLFGLEAAKRIETTGRNGGPILSLDMSQLSDEQLERLCTGDVGALEASAGDPARDPGAGVGGAGAPPTRTPPEG